MPSEPCGAELRTFCEVLRLFSLQRLSFRSWPRLFLHVGSNFFFRPLRRALNSADNFRFVVLTLFDQLFHAFRIGVFNVRQTLNIARLPRGHAAPRLAFGNHLSTTRIESALEPCAARPLIFLRPPSSGPRAVFLRCPSDVRFPRNASLRTFFRSALLFRHSELHRIKNLAQKT